jgi:hypothetical protein
MKSLDAQKAAEIHRSTCEGMGVLDSCLALGNMHYVGHGQLMVLYTQSFLYKFYPSGVTALLLTV